MPSISDQAIAKHSLIIQFVSVNSTLKGWTFDGNDHCNMVKEKLAALFVGIY